MSPDYYSFKPNFFIHNGFAQTIVGAMISGKASLPKRKIHKVKLNNGSKLILLELLSNSFETPIILLSHGMGGCSESNYMKRIAFKLWKRGLNVFMMNQRGCGLGMGLSKTLWNGGSSGDLDKVIVFISRLYPKRMVNIVGFSLSGNVLLKYLGENSTIPLTVNKAFAVNPPIDLRRSSIILSYSRKGIIFNNHFMKLIHRQASALSECFSDVVLPNGSEKTIYEFDISYTVPAAGYKDVEDYYSKSSAKDYLEGISVPTTILCSEDDPFIQTDIFKSLCITSYIEIFTPKHGGHMGYILDKPTSWGDYHWMDSVIVDWAQETK